MRPPTPPPNPSAPSEPIPLPNLPPAPLDCSGPYIFSLSEKDLANFHRRHSYYLSLLETLLHSPLSDDSLASLDRIADELWDEGYDNTIEMTRMRVRYIRALMQERNNEKRAPRMSQEERFWSSPAVERRERKRLALREGEGLKKGWKPDDEGHE